MEVDSRISACSHFYSRSTPTPILILNLTFNLEVKTSNTWSLTSFPALVILGEERERDPVILTCLTDVRAVVVGKDTIQDQTGAMEG